MKEIKDLRNATPDDADAVAGILNAGLAEWVEAADTARTAMSALFDTASMLDAATALRRFPYFSEHARKLEAAANTTDEVLTELKWGGPFDDFIEAHGDAVYALGEYLALREHPAGTADECFDAWVDVDAALDILADAVEALLRGGAAVDQSG